MELGQEMAQLPIPISGIHVLRLLLLEARFQATVT
jgi:hypothetical protein